MFLIYLTFIFPSKPSSRSQSLTPLPSRYPLIAGKGRAGLTQEKYPILFAFAGRLEEEPGYKKACDKIVEIDGKFEATPKM